MSGLYYNFVFEEKKETPSVFGLNWMRNQEDWMSGFEKHQEDYDMQHVYYGTNFELVIPLETVHLLNL